MFFKSLGLLWCLALFPAICLSTLVEEREESAVITIKVKGNASGADVPNAELHFVEQSSRGQTTQQHTDGMGSAVVELNAGEYELTVTRPMYKSLVIRYIKLKPGERQRLDLAHESGSDSHCCQDPEPLFGYELERAELKGLEIRAVKIFAWQVSKKKKYVEVETFREAPELHLSPANRFDVVCEVVGGSDTLSGDYFLLTTIDFLVAPVRSGYEQMDDKTLGSSVGWGQVSEMRDLVGASIYGLRPDETKRVTIKGLDLSPVPEAFPMRDAGDLWPWLVRVTVHVQDRSGKQIAFAERILRLSPSSARKRSHYNDPIPTR